MPVFRNRRMHFGAWSVTAVLLGALSLLAFTGPNQAGLAANPATPVEEETPVSEATADDVTIGLLPGASFEDDAFTAKIRIENKGAMPVSFEEGLIELEIRSPDGTSAVKIVHESSPALPCSLPSGKQLVLSLTFELSAGEEPVSLTVGFIEVERSGAKVILPFAAGSGASAIGGAGMPGASATGGANASTPQAMFPAEPGASPEAGGCQ